MTDKVQKIREEVERLQNELIQEREKCYGSDVDDACILELQNVLTYIDSLQEEPVSKVWHDANEEQPEEYRTVVVWNPITMDGEVLTRCTEVYKGRIWAWIEDLLNLSNVQRTVKNWKELVSDELEKEIVRYVGYPQEVDEDISTTMIRKVARHFAEWQKENLWKPADGDNLPEIDREVIALLDNGKVVFAHRPDHKGWDGKSFTSGKVEHYTPKTYDKGGWNQPNVKWWIDVELPKEIES